MKESVNPTKFNSNSHLQPRANARLCIKPPHHALQGQCADTMAFVTSFFPGNIAIARPSRACSRRNTPRCSSGTPLSKRVVTESPAIAGASSKYIFPMRDENTQIFFDNAVDDSHTVLFVFANDRHGLVLDVVSVLKALGVHVSRTASGQSQAMQLVLARTEGELRSIRGLNLALDNVVAFWIRDVKTEEKIHGGDRIAQLTTCLRLELMYAHPRPRPADESDWHRVIVEKNRADRYTAFAVQTRDRPGLLRALTAAFDRISIDVASASIGTNNGRAENVFFVTKRGFKCPLFKNDLENALEEVMRALLEVASLDGCDTLWYQTREGSSVLVSEALFVDVVNNEELIAFSKHETPNFRGRLPEAPYQPVSLQ